MLCVSDVLIEGAVACFSWFILMVPMYVVTVVVSIGLYFV